MNPFRKAFSAARNLIFSPAAARLVGEPFFSMEGMRAGGSLKLKDIKSILVVKLDEIGDAVMLTPFMRELRAALPDAWITLVVKPQLRELWEPCPYINELLAYDRQIWPKANLHSHWSALSFAKKNLWKRRFDLAVVPRWDADRYNAAYLSYFSGARHRVSYSEKVTETKARINKGYDSLFSLVSSFAGLKHESERNLDLLKGLGMEVSSSKTELWVTDKDEAAADELLFSRGITASDRFVCLYPSGGSSALKQWPAANFIDLGRWIIEACGLKVLVVGGPGDGDVCREVSDGIGPLSASVSGKLGLRVAAAVLKRCALFVGNDTGPTHIAAAVGARVVAIFGASCPHRFAPSGDNCTVIWKGLECSACHLQAHADRCAQCVYERPACLDAITVEEMRGVVSSALQQRQ